MRTYKDPKARPDVMRKRQGLVEEVEDTAPADVTPPKKRRPPQKNKKADDEESVGSGSVAENQSDILSEKGSEIGDDDRSSTKSTPPKKSSRPVNPKKNDESSSKEILNGEIDEIISKAEKGKKARQAINKKLTKEIQENKCVENEDSKIEKESEHLEDIQHKPEDTENDKVHNETKSETINEAITEKITPLTGTPTGKGKKKTVTAKKKDVKKDASCEDTHSQENGEESENLKETTPVKKKRTKKVKTNGNESEKGKEAVVNNAEEVVKKPAKRGGRPKKVKDKEDGEETPKKEKKKPGRKKKAETTVENKTEGDNSDIGPPKPKKARKTKKQIEKEKEPSMKEEAVDKMEGASEAAKPKPRKKPGPKKKEKVAEKVDSKEKIVKKEPNEIKEMKSNEVKKEASENQQNSMLAEAKEEKSEKASEHVRSEIKSEVKTALVDGRTSEGALMEEAEENSEDESELNTSFESLLSSERDDIENVQDQQDDEKSGEVSSENKENKEMDTSEQKVGKEIVNIKCEFCGYNSKSKGGHTRHLRKCQPDKFNLEVKDSSTPKVPKVHNCEHCDYTAPRRVLIINHMKVHGIFQCKRCKFCAEDEAGLTEHMLTEHKDRSECKFCKICNRYVKCNEIPLETHMETCKGRVPFKCPECDKTFQYESSLKCHVVSHYPDKPKLFSCTECEYKSNYKANLKKHMRHIHQVSKERNIQCPQCDKKFFTEDNMKRHVKLHTEERPYRCMDCEKTFKTAAVFKSHSIAHQEDRPFICGINDCLKEFKSKKHLRTHIDEFHKFADPSYHCSVDGCGASFYKKSHLDRHELTHTGERNYLCDFEDCGKTFRHPDNLRVHQLQHTDERPIKCEYCAFECRQKASLQWHINHTHPEHATNLPAGPGSNSAKSDVPLLKLSAEGANSGGDNSVMVNGAENEAESDSLEPGEIRRRDLYEFKSDEESVDEMKPGLLKTELDKDKPPLPPVENAALLAADITPLPGCEDDLENKDGVNDEGVEKEKLDNETGEKTEKPKKSKSKKKPEKAATGDNSGENPKPKKRGRKKKEKTEGEEEGKDGEEKKKPKGKRGASPKGKKDGEEESKGDNPDQPVKKKRGPKKKVVEQKEGEEGGEVKVPKKRGRKKKSVEGEGQVAKVPKSITKSEDLDELLDAVAHNYGGDSGSETEVEFPDEEVEGQEKNHDEAVNAGDGNEEDQASDHEHSGNKVEKVELSSEGEKVQREENNEKEGENGEAVVKESEAKEKEEDKESVKSAVGEESDQFSSDLDTDFEEDIKPPPAPRPPPMYDSEDGDIESGPDNEDFNNSTFSNEPLRDFESSREISRDFESSRDNMNDSIKSQTEAGSVEARKESVESPEKVQQVRDEMNKENQEQNVNVPSHDPPSAEYNSHVDETNIDSVIKSQGQDENTQSSMPEVDKDYVGRYFEEIQSVPDLSRQDPISRLNSMEEPKSQETIEEQVTRDDSGVPSSLTSSHTEIQTPPTEMSNKRMEILASDRQQEEHYQPRTDNPISSSRPSERSPGIVYDAFHPLNPFSSTSRESSAILRQNDPLYVPSTTASSFMRFPDGDPMRQQMASSYDRNLQNLHRITDSALSQNSASPLLRRSNPVPGREDVFSGAAAAAATMTRNPFHSSWPSQDVRPPHWGHPTYLQRPLDQQAGSSPSLFSKENYLAGREFMFDPARSVAERNMFSSLSSPQTQRPDLPHDTFQFDHRFDISSYFGSHGYSPSPSLPVDYTRSAHSSSQKSLEERYRQGATGMGDIRTLPQTSTADMFGSINMNTSLGLDKYVYPRDPMYPQHMTDNTNSAFFTHGVPTQHAMFGRDYPRSFYPQNSPYSFVNMNDKNYAAAAASAKLTHPASGVPQERDFVPRPNTAAPESQIQDPYRHHSTMLYNMMNRYFE